MRLLIVDDNPARITNATWWMQLGASAFVGAFDRTASVRTLPQFYAALQRYPDATHVQVWGHGSPGRPGIGGKAIDPGDDAWRTLRGGVVWFRSCKVAQGVEGKAFCAELSLMGVSVAAHLSNIGALGHSHLVGAQAHTVPWWSATQKPKHSHPFAPRTVPPFAMALPSWTFSPKR